MKTNFFLITVIAVALFSSCRKERVCECTTTSVPNSSVFTTTTSTNTYTYKKTSKKEIKNLCKSYTQVNAGFTNTVDCKIK